MTRKFVTGDDKRVVVHQKVTDVETQCTGCGAKMTVKSNRVGDVLCPDCMNPTSYELRGK